MSRIFITGGNGNLGRELSKIASKLNLEFILLDRTWMYSPRSFANFASVNFSEGDLFLHFGWETKDKSRKSQLRCFVATEELAETCRMHKVNLIFPSTHYASTSSGSHYAESKFLSEIAVQENRGIVLKLGLIVSPELAEIHPLLRLLGHLPFYVSLKQDDGVVYITEKQHFLDYIETQLRVWQTNPSDAFMVQPIEKRRTILALQEEYLCLRKQNQGNQKRKVLTVNPRLVVKLAQAINKIGLKKLNALLDPILNIASGLNGFQNNSIV